MSGSEQSAAEAEAEAARRFAEARWPDGIRCAHCGSERVAERNRPERRWPQWRCRDCRKEFTAVTGTALHATKRSPTDAGRDHSTLRATPSQRAYTADDDVRDPTGTLSAAARAVLNALRQRPHGATAGKVAEIAGTSSRHARRILQQLATAGLARSRDGQVRDGHRSRPRQLWELTYTPECVRLLGHLPQQRAPMPAPPVSDAVPPQFWSRFWSGSEGSELSVSRDELHVAGTLIGSMDLAAEAWALHTVSDETLATLAETRGYDTGDIHKLIRSELRRRSRVAA